MGVVLVLCWLNNNQESSSRSCCCAGLRNQQPLSAEDQSSLVDILSDAFPTVSEEFLFEIVSDRSAAERKYD
jgi:hypothetical protein